MKASSLIVLHRKRNAAGRTSPFIVFLAGLGLTLMVLLLAAGVGIGVYFAVYSQSFPSLETFRLRYSVRPEPTAFYARDGETLLFTLAYDNFESRDLSFCEADGEGCFPKTFIEAARISYEEGPRRSAAVSAAETMVGDVYGEYIAGTRFPRLSAFLLTRQVIRTFGEDQILSWHYNNAWFGQMAFGLDAASRLYLDKGGDSLSDAECVLMSAIIRSPMLNPIDSKGALRDSYLEQLQRLHQAGLFSDEEIDSLSRNNFVIFEPPQYTDGALPDIITRKALDSVVLLYGREQVERGGLKVVTSEDPVLQQYLVCVTSAASEEEASACPLSEAFNESELKNASEALRTVPVSAAVTDVTSGQLLAALEAQAGSDGTRIYRNIQQTYPLGTELNFFSALTAFSGGSSPSTLLWDLNSSYDSGTELIDPETEPYHGPVLLRDALTNDYRRPLSAHLRTFGSGAVRRNAALFGLNNSSILSENDILNESVSDTAEALAFSLLPFAALGEQSGTDNGGSMRPVTILRVDRADGETEYPQHPAKKSLIASNLAYLVHNVFSQTTDKVSLSDRPSAVKTGRVSGEENAWTAGYTTRLSCAVRVGSSQTYSAFISDGTRGRENSEILWRSVMEFAHRGLPASGWDVPADISQVRVCLPSGKLPTAACKETVTEVFLRGSEPYEYDEYYVEVPINRENRMLATRYTPPENITSEVFLNLPDDAADWAAENGIERMPAEYDPIRGEVSQNDLRIESPERFQTFDAGGAEKIDIIVRLNLPSEPESVQVSIGSGMYPERWTEVCTGESLENGRWLLCTLDPASLDPGLYALRTAFIFPGQAYRSAETYFEINASE